MQQLAGGALVERDVDASDESILAFIAGHGSLAAAEIQAAFGLSPDETEVAIARLESRGSVERRKVGNGFFFRSTTAPACSSATGLCQASV
jgi:DNA-binding transcriptional ArsR family regulator